MNRLLFAIMAAVLSACAQPAMAPPSTQREATAKVDWQSATNADQCSTIGGEWRPICMLGKPACVVAYKDAGKACTDSSQCSGRCITGSTGAKPEAPTTGVCTANSDPCGCFQLVENGKAGYALCAD